MEFVPLHYKLDYLNDCAEVLNEEWPRSKTARIHSLEKSCDSLPTCLILLDEHRNLIGHSRLSDMRGMDGACLVESVVVRRRERGKGYGREVMAATERYAKRNGFEWMYLTTHDKQKFYEKLGYQYCDPVVSFGGDFSNLPESFTRALAGLSGRDRGDITRSSKAAEQTQQHCQQMDDQTKTPGGNCVKTNANHCLVNAAPAPTSPFTETQTSGTLPPPTAPPPPPPPPPPIPQSAGSKQKVAVVRWDPSKVSWMRKQLESN